MKFLLVSIVAISLFSSSCNFMNGQRVQGDGNVTIQTRSVSDFNQIDVSTAIDVYVTQDSSYTAKVEVDNNLQELIEVYVDGNVLRIHPKNNFNLNPSRGMKVQVSAPLFRKLEASGACKLVSRNQLSSSEGIAIGMSGACEADLDLKAPTVTVDLSGATTVRLKGQTRDLSIDGSGSSDVKAFDLLSENARIDMSGAGSVELFASSKITAQASGASDIRYKGNASVSSDISGAGSVKKVD